MWLNNAYTIQTKYEIYKDQCFKIKPDMANIVQGFSVKYI